MRMCVCDVDYAISLAVLILGVAPAVLAVVGGGSGGGSRISGGGGGGNCGYPLTGLTVAVDAQHAVQPC